MFTYILETQNEVMILLQYSRTKFICESVNNCNFLTLSCDGKIHVKNDTER